MINIVAVHISILVLLVLFFLARLRAVLRKGLEKTDNAYRLMKEEHDRLSRESLLLKERNSRLENILNETKTLYYVTKEMSKYLEEESFFQCFKDHLSRYLKVEDLRFLKGAEGLKGLSEHIILPCKIRSDRPPIGYLVAGGIKPEETEKFYILGHQFILGIKRAYLYRLVQEMAITDTLTGVFSRRYFLERLNEEMERSKRFNFSFSFIMIDVDYFKDYNDRFGHLVGDTVLKSVSKIIKDNIRQIDFLGRYGGEEFSIILTETKKNEAAFVAQRIIEAVAAKRIMAYDEELKITISAGVSSFPADANTPEQAIEKADQALYRAKETGRNRVCLY